MQIQVSKEFQLLENQPETFQKNLSVNFISFQNYSAKPPSPPNLALCHAYTCISYHVSHGHTCIQPCGISLPHGPYSMVMMPCGTHPTCLPTISPFPYEVCFNRLEIQRDSTGYLDFTRQIQWCGLFRHSRYRNIAGLQPVL